MFNDRGRRRGGGMEGWKRGGGRMDGRGRKKKGGWMEGRGWMDGWMGGWKGEDGDTDETISPVENPIFAILTKIHL